MSSEFSEKLAAKMAQRKIDHEQAVAEKRQQLNQWCADQPAGTLSEADFEEAVLLLVRRDRLVRVMSQVEPFSDYYNELSQDITESCDVYLAPMGLV